MITRSFLRSSGVPPTPFESIIQPLIQRMSQSRFWRFFGRGAGAGRLPDSAETAGAGVMTSLAALSLAFSLPFQVPFRLFPILGFYPEWLAFAFGTLALAVLPFLVARRPHTLALPRLLWAPLLLAGVIGAQVVAGRIPYVELALIAVCYLLWFAALAVLGAHLNRVCGESVFTVMAWALAAGSLLAALTGWAQLLGLDERWFPWIVPPAGTVIFGNLGQPNQFGLYLAIGLASVAHLAATRRLPLPVAAAWAFVLLFLLPLTGSRAGNALVAGLVICAGVLHGLCRNEASRLRLRLAALFWAAHALLVSLTAESLAVKLPVAAVAQSGHWSAWGLAWQVFLDHPGLGAGFGQFAWEVFQRAGDWPVVRTYGVWTHSHNALLELLAGTGLSGALAVLVPLGLWASRIRWRAPSAGQGWALTVLAMLLACSMFEYPLWYAYFLGIAAVLAGALESVPREYAASRTVRLAAIAALVLAIVALAGTLSDFRELRRTVAPVADEPRPGVIGRYDTLIRLRRESLLAPWAEWSLVDLYLTDPDRAGRHLAASERALRFLPTRHRAYEHALMLEFAGKREAALAQLDLAMRAYPDDRVPFLLWLERNAEDRLWKVPGLIRALREAGANK